MQILYLAVAGALGAVSRFLLSGFIYRLLGSGFPYGTLLINVIGSLLIGFIMQVGLSTDIIPQQLRTVITIGFLGAFTTFSTFSYETLNYIQDGVWGMAILNIAANVIVCLLAVFAGLIIGKLTLGGA
ncbi:MAG TPA: fluoride efflux transporter CrcB [Dehalococcoidia bacterium]|nr:fluoride efflux transporter CrcB [Dehalococcoidia bacterium]